MLTSGDIFTVRRLGRDSGDMERALQRTFSLVSMLMPAITIREWNAIVRHYRSKAVHAGGLMVIEDARGYAHGLFSYSIDRAPSLHAFDGLPSLPAPVLCLRDLVLVHAPGGDIEQVLARSAEERAHALGCRSIRLEFLDLALRPAGAAAFARLGYARRSGNILAKPVIAGVTLLAAADLGAAGAAGRVHP